VQPIDIFDFLEKLFPGDRSFGYQGFDHEMYIKLEERFPELNLVLNYFEEYVNKYMASTVQLSEAINFLSFLKRSDLNLHRAFISQLLNIYLKSNSHDGGLLERPYISGITKTLPEINYDLLEPVIERGQIWRKDGFD
jgi:hypothetical protein